MAKYHVIWCLKHRRRVIGGRIEARHKQLIGQIVAEYGGEVIELETMPDHVHLLGVIVVRVNPAHTSTECRVCGHSQPENRESQAVFRCLACGHHGNADTHAATVILARGLQALRPPQDMGQDPHGSACVNSEQSVARTPRSQAAA